MVLTPLDDMRNALRTTIEDPELRPVFVRRFGRCDPDLITRFFLRCRLAELSATLYEEPTKMVKIPLQFSFSREGGRRITLLHLAQTLDQMETNSTARDSTHFLREEDGDCLDELIRICVTVEDSLWR